MTLHLVSDNFSEAYDTMSDQFQFTDVLVKGKFTYKFTHGFWGDGIF